MGERNAQEFWDQMWYWESYEVYPGESMDDPHLVINLGFQVENAGPTPDTELLRRFDACVGRVMNRLDSLLPRSGERVDLDEFKQWLKFGLNPNIRGHDASITPIIDAEDLSIFRRFVNHAIEYSKKHGLSDIQKIWEDIGDLAEKVDNEHTGTPQPSRFLPT